MIAKNDQNNVTRDKKFDTLDIPACVRGGERRVSRSAPASPSGSKPSQNAVNSGTHDTARAYRRQPSENGTPPRRPAHTAHGPQTTGGNIPNPMYGDTTEIKRPSPRRSAPPSRGAAQDFGRTAAFTRHGSAGDTVEFRRPAASAGAARPSGRQTVKNGPNNGPVAPLYGKKKREYSLLSAAAELLHRRSVLMALSLCLLLVIIIPIAVFAATAGNEGDIEPDFELTESAASKNAVLYADSLSTDSVKLGNAVINTPSEPGITADDNGADEGKGSASAETLPDPDPAPEDERETDTGADEDADLENDNTSGDAGAESPTTGLPEVYTVTFMFYDREPLTCMSSPSTLREILAGSGYYLTDSDKVYVDMDTVIDSDQTVYIDRIEYGTVTETEYMPYEVETVEVQTIPRGTYQTISAGVSGSKDTVYNVEYVNGVEVSRTESYSYISAYPQNQVDQYGVGGVVYGDDGSAHSFSYCVEVRATYYNLPGNTASGMPVQDGVIAVDPSVFPLGTYLYVKNNYMDMGVRVCDDTGVYGNTIDIWMNENSPYFPQFASQGVFYFTAYVLD